VETESGAAGPAQRSPGDFIREELEARNWTQADLAKILGRPLPTVNGIIQGKHSILPDMAIALGEAFGTGPEVWMRREADYRLSLAKEDGQSVRKRARMYEVAPIKEMQRRGWIQNTNDPGELERELLRFFEVDRLDSEPEIVAAFRRSTAGEDMTPAQRAWCFRVKQLAKTLRVAPFKPERLVECKKQLQKLAAFPQEARKVPTLLASFGIRFVIVEPLQGSKIDGAALWLDPQSPIIALTMRFDRVDAFWHNLGHEFSHIEHGDAISVDSDLVGQDRIPDAAKTPVERRADREAAAMFVPPKELESFVLRVAPLFSKERIIQFANKIKIHPGIIVGQLQHRGEIGFHANREMLVKVRSLVVPAAVTDGWGETIDPRVFK